MASATPTTVRTTITEKVPERTSWRYTATMKDEAGLAIAQSDIFTLTLTIYNLDAMRTIVNNCEAEDIFNMGRGTVGATDGSLVILFDPDDSEMVDTTKANEQHVALIEVTWLGGTKSAAHEVAWTVVNMDRRI